MQDEVESVKAELEASEKKVEAAIKAQEQNAAELERTKQGLVEKGAVSEELV